MKVDAPSRGGKSLSKTGMYIGGGVIAVVIGGVIYVLSASNQDWATEGEAPEIQLRASRASASLLPPPTDLSPPTDEPAPTPPENSKPSAPPLPAPPSIKEIAEREAAMIAWKDYYATTLALEKKRVDALEKGMNSLWEPRQSPPEAQRQGPVGEPQVMSASSPAGTGGPWTQASDKLAWGASGNASNYVQSVRSGPASPYQIMAGNYIPAKTRGGLTSDAPASIVGEISSNINCDTPAGRAANKPCIPAGTRVLISYNTKVTQGECRVQVAADRLIFPDATSMDLDHMPIGDASGYAGLQDECDTHLGARLLNAVLFTTVQGAFGLGQAALGANYVSGSAVESVAQQETASGMRIPPTLSVRPGYPFTIMLRKDLVFEEPYTPMTGEGEWE